MAEVEYKDFRNEEEREFLTRLHGHAAVWERSGYVDDDFTMFYDGDTVTVAFDICSENSVLRSLRVDFNDTNLLLGEDATSQFVCKLNVDDSEVKEYKKSQYSTKDLAEIAANWIAFELSRKIELREWSTASFRHRQYVLADTEKPICWSDSENKSRPSLGKPDTISIVYPIFAKP